MDMMKPEIDGISTVDFTSYHHIVLARQTAVRCDLSETSIHFAFTETLEVKGRKVNDSSTFRLQEEVLEEVLHIQLDNALIGSTRLAVHNTEFAGVVVWRDGF